MSKKDGTESSEMSFWDHLDALRGTLLRSAGVVLVIALVLFIVKDYFFDIVVLAPTQPDFFVYKLFGMSPKISLVNYDLTAQFMVHLETSLLGALVFGAPYICFELWKFIAPALYEKEKKAVRKAFLFAGCLFYVGLAVGYCILLPFIVDFFQGYTVSSLVTNTISLSSYISTFFSTVFSMGLAFEFPSVIMVLSNLGLLHKSTLKKYRRHALVVLMIIAAAITPADLMSMIVVTIPLYLLYEFSILICRKDEPEDDYDEDEDDSKGKDGDPKSPKGASEESPAGASSSAATPVPSAAGAESEAEKAPAAASVPAQEVASAPAPAAPKAEYEDDGEGIPRIFIDDAD